MRFLLLVLTLAVSIQACSAAYERWSFPNWNKYKSKGSTSWFKAWKIPKSDGWSWPKNDGNNKIVNNPVKSKKDAVLEVTYPKGSINPQGSPQGGIGFYAQPIKLRKEAKLVVLEYQVYFPKKFNFVKGGKLPGLYGGHQGCSGGASASTCFSTRFMWRREGAGEVYAYLPESKQRKSLCNEKGNICNPNYGYSLGRGSWTFKTGEWTTVRQTLKLNTPGKENGIVRVDVNGKKVYSESKLVFLSRNTGQVVGVAFHTFFGGNGKDWASPKKQNTFFRGFKLRALY